MHPPQFEDETLEDFEPLEQYPLLTVYADNFRIQGVNNETDAVFHYSSNTATDDHFLDFIEEISTSDNTREEVEEDLENYGSSDINIIRNVQVYWRESEEVTVDIKMQKIRSGDMILLVIHFVPQDFDGEEVFPLDPILLN